MQPNTPDPSCPPDQVYSAMQMTSKEIVDILRENASGSGCETRIMYCQLAMLSPPPTSPNPFQTLCMDSQDFCNGYYWGPLSVIKGNPYFIIDEINDHKLPNIIPFFESPSVL